MPPSGVMPAQGPYAVILPETNYFQINMGSLVQPVTGLDDDSSVS